MTLQIINILLINLPASFIPDLMILFFYFFYFTNLTVLQIGQIWGGNAKHYLGNSMTAYRLQSDHQDDLIF